MSSSQEKADSESGGSDSTIEEELDLSSAPLGWSFGYPLERTRRVENVDRTDDEAATLNQFCAPSFSYGNKSCASSDSNISTTSSVVYDIDFEALIDELLAREPLVANSDSFTILEPSSKDANDSIMIKCLPLTAPELVLLLELNHPELRDDPWNPAPHILCAVERGEHVFLCMERLVEFDQPPFKTVANYIDFFRQVLEGLTFLHEHDIAQLSCSDSQSLMVAVGICPSSLEQFDRALYPVRYYFVDFSQAVRFDGSSTNPTPFFRKDVQECGFLIDEILTEVPRVGPELKALVKAMTSGEFGADNARKLLEALCKSLESSVFDTLVTRPSSVKRRMTITASTKNVSA